MGYRSSQLAKQQADQAFLKWQAQQGIAATAPTPVGIEGYTQGGGVIPVTPHYTGAGLQKAAGVGVAKAPVKLPEGYQESLSNAIGWLESKGDSEETRWQVFQKLSVAFPERSAELKRIFIPSAKLGELNIIDELKALRGK